MRVISRITPLRRLTPFLLILLTNYLSSQSYLVHTYTEYDGLPSSYVKDIAQDSSGVIWFATRGGIASYDGVEWKTYSVSDGLPSSDFYAIKVDRQGTVWAMTKMVETILHYFDGSEWLSIPSPFENLEQRKFITCFDLTYVNNQTLLAVGTKKYGLYFFHNGQWINITKQDGLLSSSVNAIASFNEQFYVATSNGLSIVKGDKVDNSLNQTINTPSTEIIGIAIGSKTSDSVSEIVQPSIWILGIGWVGYIEDKRFELLSDSVKAIKAPIIYGEPVVLQPDHGRGLYFGTAVDLFHINRRDRVIKHMGTENGLITVGTTAMLLDRENNLWIAGLRGVSKIVSMRFANYRKEDGLLEDEVTAITESESGLMVFGHNRGLTVFDGFKFQRKSFPKSKITTQSGARIMDLRKDFDGNIWAAVTSLGVAKIDRSGTTTLYDKRPGLDGNIYSVMIDHSGKLWAGGGKGLFILENEKFVPVPMGKLPRPTVRRIVQASDHSVYVATSQNGVYVFRNNKWIQYYSPDEENNNNIYSIFQDSKGTVWVGSLGGLLLFDRDSITKFRVGHFQIDRPVYLITEDTKGRLWFGTDNGVTRWDGRNVREYTIRQGLSGQETNRAAGFVDSQGRLWIGTDQGVSRYQEEYDSMDIPPPVVELLPVEVSGETRPPLSYNKLSYSENDLVFPFRAVSFIDEDNVFIKRKLEGFDKEWIAEQRGKRNLIRYLQLSPGYYRFHLQARNAAGTWSQVVSSPQIIIQKPFWQKWWFYMISLLLISSTVYVVLKYFSEKRYAFRLETEVSQRTKELQQSKSKLKISLEEKEVLLREIHHRVKNNLQVISSLLNLQSSHIKDKKVRGQFRDSRDRVKSMALIHEKLYQSEDLGKIDFGDYIRELTDHLLRSYRVNPNMIDLMIDSDDVYLDIDTAISCGLIIHELVSNSFKHAFSKGNKGEIRIDLRQGGNHELILVISDDGIGIPKNIDFKKTASLGLQLVNTLVEQLDGNIELQPNGGTRFKITFESTF